MAKIASLDHTASAYVARGALSLPTEAASGELAKLESQLSDWVHCPSSKTSAGKAKIAEITAKIETIKGQAKAVEDKRAKEVPRLETQEPSKTVVGGLRFDGLGAWINERA